jgi:hypothetical protein
MIHVLFNSRPPTTVVAPSCRKVSVVSVPAASDGPVIAKGGDDPGGLSTT